MRKRVRELERALGLKTYELEVAGESIARSGVRERVARCCELVVRRFRARRLARVMQVTRQAIYRVPTPRTAPQPRPATDPVEAAIVEEGKANQTDGYLMVTAFVRRGLGIAVNRKRVLRVMRERRLIQRRRPLERREAARLLPGRADPAAGTWSSAAAPRRRSRSNAPPRARA